MPLLAVVIAVLLCAAGAPAASAASWTEQRVPSGGAASNVGPPALATNPRGDTAVAWRAGARAYLSVRRGGNARFGRRIALPAYADARVAVLTDGTVLVATARNDATTGGRRPCCGAIYVQRLRPGTRRLSVPRIVTVPGASAGGFEWALVAGPRGRAAVIADAQEVSLVTSRRGGVFGDPAWPSLGRYGNPRAAAFGGDGRGVALWVEGSNHEQRLRGAPIRRDTSVGAARTYVDTPDTRSDFSFFSFDAGLDADSRLTALWVDTGGLGSAPGAISVATGTTAGPLGPRQILASPAGLGAGVAEPDLAVAPDGRALATWRVYGAASATVVAMRRSRAGRFAVLAPLATSGSGQRVALLSGGRGIVVGAVAGATTARSVSPSGVYGVPRRLRGALGATGTNVVAGAGRFTLAWGTRTGLRVATSRPG